MTDRKGQPEETHQTTLEFEASAPWSQLNIHEALCKAIHEGDSEALQQLADHILDIKYYEPNVDGAIEYIIRSVDPDDERTEEVLRTNIADALHYAIRGPSDMMEERMRAQGDMSNADLGALLRDYLSESDHQGWEGYNARDQLAINSLVRDMMLYHDLSREDEGVLEREDVDITYVDEVVQEYAELRGKTDSEDLVADRARFQMLQDAIRCAIDPAELRKWIKKVEEDEDIYREQV